MKGYALKQTKYIEVGNDLKEHIGGSDIQL